MTTFINRGLPVAATNPYYRQAAYVPPPPRPVADVRDDYERTFNNLHSNGEFPTYNPQDGIRKQFLTTECLFRFGLEFTLR